MSALFRQLAKLDVFVSRAATLLLRLELLSNLRERRNRQKSTARV